MIELTVTRVRHEAAVIELVCLDGRWVETTLIAFECMFPAVCVQVFCTRLLLLFILLFVSVPFIFYFRFRLSRFLLVDMSSFHKAVATCLSSDLCTSFIGAVNREPFVSSSLHPSSLFFRTDSFPNAQGFFPYDGVRTAFKQYPGRLSVCMTGTEQRELRELCGEEPHRDHVVLLSLCTGVNPAAPSPVAASTHTHTASSPPSPSSPVRRSTRARHAATTTDGSSPPSFFPLLHALLYQHVQNKTSTEPPSTVVEIVLLDVEHCFHLNDQYVRVMTEMVGVIGLVSKWTAVVMSVPEFETRVRRKPIKPIPTKEKHEQTYPSIVESIVSVLNEHKHRNAISTLLKDDQGKMTMVDIGSRWLKVGAAHTCESGTKAELTEFSQQVQKALGMKSLSSEEVFRHPTVGLLAFRLMTLLSEGDSNLQQTFAGHKHVQRLTRWGFVLQTDDSLVKCSIWDDEDRSMFLLVCDGPGSLLGERLKELYTLHERHVTRKRKDDGECLVDEELNKEPTVKQPLTMNSRKKRKLH